MFFPNGSHSTFHGGSSPTQWRNPQVAWDRTSPSSHFGSSAVKPLLFFMSASHLGSKRRFQVQKDIDFDGLDGLVIMTFRYLEYLEYLMSIHLDISESLKPSEAMVSLHFPWFSPGFLPRFSRADLG